VPPEPGYVSAVNSGETFRVEDRSWTVGDRIITRRNDRRLDVDNGTPGTITAYDRSRMAVQNQTDNGEHRWLNLHYLALQALARAMRRSNDEPLAAAHLAPKTSRRAALQVAGQQRSSRSLRAVALRPLRRAGQVQNTVT
jgi:hypothetical protein